mmetsp:Transcript_39616/g.35380  ORF Transcript_39616/g.35380 Transcript_39616/m.35380 type:complete len:148 (+) Transcript_39616:1134-1577(+)
MYYFVDRDTQDEWGIFMMGFYNPNIIVYNYNSGELVAYPTTDYILGTDSTTWVSTNGIYRFINGTYNNFQYQQRIGYYQDNTNHWFIKNEYGECSLDLWDSVADSKSTWTIEQSYCMPLIQFTVSYNGSGTPVISVVTQENVDVADL